MKSFLVGGAFAVLLVSAARESGVPGAQLHKRPLHINEHSVAQRASHRAAQRRKPRETKPMDFAEFDWSKLEAERAKSKKPWLAFIDNSTMTCGVYRLAKGSKDGQSPHALDEVYYVVSGKAKFKAGDKTVDCKPGSVLFVKAKVEHRFFDIEEDLTTLVFFSKVKPKAEGKDKRD